ncbi:MAG: glycoside hydrolase family 18 protein [Terriglobales bacterium]|jgi:chitinase
MESRTPSTLVLSLLLLFGLSAIVVAPAQGQQTQRLPKRLVADYTAGSKYENPPYDVAQIPFRELTHIIHAGIPWNSDGSLSIPTGFVEPDLIKKAHQNGVKVMLLTGGDFAAIETSPQIFDTVLENLQSFVTTNGYDGIDIDWEFPSDGVDRAFFVTLMTRLRDTFPSPQYTLSADMAPWNGAFYDLDQMKIPMDFFNLMVYDCAGPWTSIGQLNSPIFWDPSNPRPWECEPGGSDQQAGDLFLKHVPAEQLNMGTPFYGYFYTNISQLFEPCPNDPKTPDGFCDGTVVTVNYGPNIKPRIDKKGWQRYYDPVALVPYLVKADGSNGYITYDDEFSTYTRVYYSDWVLGLGGTFMWSLDADYDGHSQDLLNAMYQATMKSGEYR